MVSPPLTIGKLITSDQHKQYDPVILEDADRSQPIYMIGKPDKGKSTLMLNMIAQDISAGAGFVLMEPDGNLLYKILHLIPPHRLFDVLVLDYSDHAYPVPLNVFDGFEGDENRDKRDRIVTDLIAATQKIFDNIPDLGRMLLALRYSYTACLEKPLTTLLSVPRIFEHDEYRHTMTDELDDPHAAAYWRVFNRETKRKRGEIGDPVCNRLKHLYSNKVLSNILCQPKNTYDLAEHIKNGGIILVNLGRSENSEGNAGLLGTFLFSRLYQTALTLGHRSAPFTFYLDDFTEYALPVFPATFSQSPHLRFVLAHQHMAQLDDYPKVRSAILGSAGTLIVFQVSASDAERYLKPELDLDPNDIKTPKLTHIQSFETITKLTQNGYTDTIRFFTPKPTVPMYPHSAAIINNNRTRYATPRADVERYIREWYQYDDAVPTIRIKTAKFSRQKGANKASGSV